MAELFIILGLLVLSFALRTFRWVFWRKLGALGILAATFAVFYFPTGSIAAGVGGLLLWLLLPWVELLTRIRKLRLPMMQHLERQTPPSVNRFPDLAEMSDEVEAAGFEYVADTGYEWEGRNQFYRIYYDNDERTQASICLSEHDGMTWACFALTSRLDDGRIFRTTNLPFSNPMKDAPDVWHRQVHDADTFEEVHTEHQLWVSGFGFLPEDFRCDAPEELPRLIEQESGRQILHNLEEGLIRLAETAETVRYSWRGLWFLYFQLVKDVVKLV